MVADEQAEQVGGPADEQAVEASGGAVPIPREPVPIAARWAASRSLSVRVPRWAAGASGPATSGGSDDVSEKYPARITPIGNWRSSAASDVTASNSSLR